MIKQQATTLLSDTTSGCSNAAEVFCDSSRQNVWTCLGLCEWSTKHHVIDPLPNATPLRIGNKSPRSIMPYRRSGLLTCLLLLCFLEAQAQFATVEGIVRDQDGGRTMQGVNVILEADDSDRVGVASDAFGEFVFGRLLPGTYILTASFVGYTPHTDTLEIAFGDLHRLEIELAPDEEEMGEVVVESEQQTSSLEGFAAFEQVRASDLQRVPMPGVTPDLAGYLQTMPGFVSTGDRGGQMFVRGGTPTQNLVLIDGMMVYQPFHIVGFYSALPADLINYADVYAGGFGARYGGRLSSVIDVSTRNGNKDRVVGAASIAPFLGSVRVEIPIEPGKVSLIGSARESIIERIAPDVLGEQMPYRFGDRFLKLHAFITQTSTFAATYLETFDEGNITGDPNTPISTWNNRAFGGRYTYLPPDAPVIAELAAFASQWDSEYAISELQRRKAGVNNVNLTMHFIYLLGESQVDFGIFGSTYGFNYNLGDRRRDTESHVMEGSFFIDGQFQLNPYLRIEPSLRIQTFSNAISASFGPRFRALYRPQGASSTQHFSLAWGLYHQQIIGLSNAQDVTDAFIAWAPSPDNADVPKAMHLIGGWKWRARPWLEIGLEGYYKDLGNVYYPRFDNLTDRLLTLDQVDGRVQGADVNIEINRSGFFAYIGYGLSQVKYERDFVLQEPSLFDNQVALLNRTHTQRFSPAHDRRHQLNAMMQVQQGPYRFSVRWQFGSGQPFTQINGYYEVLPPNEPGSRDFHQQTGRTVISRAEPFGSRLPPYHRLDVSIQRVFRFDRFTTTLQASVINAYDRANIFNYDVFTNERIDQLPLIPSIGVQVEAL